LIRSLALGFLALTWTLELSAQATDASLSGNVTDSAGAAIAAASVEAIHQPTGRNFTLLTDSRGRFSFFQLPIGGPYLVRVRRIGYRPAQERISELRQGDRRFLELHLVPSPLALEPIEVAGSPRDGRIDRVGGSVAVAAAQIRALPTANRNFTDLAALSPWAGPQLALAGQRWTGTDFRLDGVRSRNVLRAGEYQAGPFGPPLEAIDQFEVNTGLYDVTQGRQGGGEVAALTRSGTNTWQSGVFAAYRSEALAAGLDYEGRGRAARPFTALQWGGSLGGPLLRDRAHLFLAAERQDGSSPLLIGLLDTDAAQLAAGIARDSLDRILAILASTYGTVARPGQLGRLPRSPAASSLFGRIDWSLAPAHLLTVRQVSSWWSNPLSGGVDQPLALREARSDFSSAEHQALLSLRSTLSDRSQNELRLSFASARRELVPVSPGVPRGFVQVRSALPDGTTGNTTVQFGGNRLAPDRSREWSLQLAELLFRRLGAVELTLGTDAALTRLSTLIAESQTGLFVFPSIDALAARQASRFTRTVPLSGTAPRSAVALFELSAFAQLGWRLSPRVTLTGGLRWDALASLSTPVANPLVLASLGRRTDRRASDWLTLSPRGQLVWDRAGDGSSVFRFGAGLFSGTLPGYAYHNQLLNTGLTLADLDLRGAAVPQPDYPSYRRDPAAIPGVPAGVSVPPYVNLLGDRYRTPTTWKLSVAFRRRLGPGLSFTLSAAASRSRGLYHYLDRNLRAAPAFSLDAEGGRGVYVPAASISTAGLTDVRNALVTQSLGRVLALESVAQARSRGVALELALRPPNQRFRLELGYALNDARDNSTYECCLARTAAAFTPVATDPRDLSRTWSPSDLDVRHRLVISGVTGVAWGISLAGRMVASSGRRYSLVVDGDLNGDEVNGNDLAFLFDPADPATPPEVAASLRRILADPNNFARGYLAAHLGRVAERNGLATPGSVRVDLRVARPITLRGRTRATLTVDLFNALNLLDAHWGAERMLPLGISSQNPLNNRVPLLRIIGFDQAARRFRYSVNETAGVLPRGGQPYQVQLGLRIDR
jgi:carboxypeptidase family protein